METTDNAPLTIDAAVDKFMASMGPEKPEDDAAPDEDQTADEGEAEESEDEAEAEEAEAEETDDDEPQDEEPEEQKAITVKVDGKEVSVTLDELKRSYSGQAYIQQQMRETAEVRKRTESDFRELQEQRERFLTYVQQVQTADLLPPTPPDPSTFQADPIGFMEQKLAYDQAMERYQQHAAEVQRLAAEQHQTMQQARARFIEEQRAKVVEMIPELKDKKQAAKVRDRLLKFGKAAGLTDDEMNNIVDARFIRVLDMASRWHETQETAKAKVQPKAQAARPVARPTAKPQPSVNAQKRHKQVRDALRAGRLDAAVDMMPWT